MDVLGKCSSLSSTPLFLNLPAELRNPIYEDLLVEREHIFLTGSEGKEKFAYYTPPSLLQVCKQIRDEAASIYYASNRFILSDPDTWSKDLAKWLESLKLKHASKINEIKAPPNMVYWEFQNLREAARLWPDAHHRDIYTIQDILIDICFQQLEERRAEIVRTALLVRIVRDQNHNEWKCCGRGRCNTQRGEHWMNFDEIVELAQEYRARESRKASAVLRPPSNTFAFMGSHSWR